MSGSVSSSKDSVQCLPQKGRPLHGCAMAAVFAIFLFASCGIPVTATSGEYRVVADREYSSSDPLPTIYSMKKMSSGGYLILGNGASREMRLLRITDGGDLSWEKRVPARRYAKHRPTFAIESDDGGFWIVGAVSEFEHTPDLDIEQIFKTDRERFHRFREVPFLSKFDANGKLEWRNPIGISEVFRHSAFLCGVRADGGLVLVGTKYQVYGDQPPRGGNSIVVHPWVVKLSPKGELIWETMLISDGADLLSAIDAIYERQCAGPFTSSDGSMAFGLQVFSHPTISKEGKRIVDGPGTRDKASPGYLVTRLDWDGKELGRALLRGEASGLLIKDGAGYVAVTNPVEVFRVLGIRRTWLGSDLAINKKSDIALAPNAFALYGAAPGPADGIHLLGNFVSQGHTGWGITHLSAGGRLGAARAVLPRSSEWNLRGYATQSATDVAVALYSDSVVRFVRFTYEK